MSWETIERPGYFGGERDAIQAEYDQKFGSDNWRLVWQIGNVLTDRQGMNMFYEDAYFFFLEKHPQILQELVTVASDVYDDALSNIGCGLDYTVQETDRTHVQDIAIRRAVLRLGETFRGYEPIQIRDTLGEHELSLALSPGRVPFHRPDLLLKPELDGWWQEGSVESFYQSNKLLQVYEK